MPVNISDIAQKAGLSKAVVSSILGGGSSNVRYSQRTRQKVLETANEMKYKIRRTHGIGLIHCSGRPRPDGKANWVEWIAPMLSALHSEALDNDQLLSLFSYTAAELGKKLNDNDLPQILRRRKIDGLVVSGNLDKELINYFHEIQLPYVLMNVSESDIHAENSVCFDEIFTGIQATDYLIQRGYRSICHVSVDWSGIHYSEPMRKQGYEIAMQNASLPTRVFKFTEADDLDCAKKFAAMIQSPNRPDAFFAYNEQVALFCLHMMHTLKLNYHDIGLIGVAWQNTKAMEIMGISHVSLPAEEMGRQAFQKLMKKIDENLPMPTISLRGNITAYQSVPGKS